MSVCFRIISLQHVGLLELSLCYYHYHVYVAGVDYKEKNMTFSMAPEQNDYVIQFEVFDDELQEKTESFFALLQLVDSSTLGAVIGRYIVQLTIVDNDGKN